MTSRRPFPLFISQRAVVGLLFWVIILPSPTHCFNILPEQAVGPNGILRLSTATSAGRNLELAPPVARRVADLMSSKNFSFVIDFALDEQTRGTLFAVHAGMVKILELYAEGYRGELRVHWRRETSLASLHIKHVYDNRFQRILLSLEGWRLRMLIDCKEVVAGDYPEIDFSLLTTFQPHIWIGQRNRNQHYFYGSYRRFDIEPTAALVRQNCGDNPPAAPGIHQHHHHHSGRIVPPQTPIIIVPSQTQQTPTPPPPKPTINGGGGRGDSAIVDELKMKIDQLEKTFNNFLYSIFPTSTTAKPQHAGNNSTTTNDTSVSGPPSPPDGVCPNCYEYLRYKVNHLEDGLRSWQDRVDKLEKNVHRIMLTQRGCQMNSSTFLEDGSTWSNPNENCSECVCTMGKVLCKPVGCTPLPSSCPSPRHPHQLRPGECCPQVESCPRSCVYMGRTYEHGRVFWPKECVRCRCENGQTSCAYRTDQCPPLDCPLERRYKHENECCPVCEYEDFCGDRRNHNSAVPSCHPNATCTNLRAGRSCECKTGFFGDGEHQCFDVDECKWDKDVAEQLGGCGPGSRCVNTPGSFYCECLPGYAKLNERTCLDMVVF